MDTQPSVQLQVKGAKVKPKRDRLHKAPSGEHIHVRVFHRVSAPDTCVPTAAAQQSRPHPSFYPFVFTFLERTLQTGCWFGEKFFNFYFYFTGCRKKYQLETFLRGNHDRTLLLSLFLMQILTHRTVFDSNTER